MMRRKMGRERDNGSAIHLHIGSLGRQRSITPLSHLGQLGRLIALLRSWTLCSKSTWCSPCIEIRKKEGKLTSRTSRGRRIWIRVTARYHYSAVANLVDKQLFIYDSY